MNIWVWIAIWAIILIGTGFAYLQIFTNLKAKAQRLEGQLAILQRNLEKLQSELEKPADFKPEPSALERDARSVFADRVRLNKARSQAKEDRERRLISRLKKLQQESE